MIVKTQYSLIIQGWLTIYNFFEFDILQCVCSNNQKQENIVKCHWKFSWMVINPNWCRRIRIKIQIQHDWKTATSVWVNFTSKTDSLFYRNHNESKKNTRYNTCIQLNEVIKNLKNIQYLITFKRSC